jgi:predicted subunit of tRNA(5-methylaminomethyl-2-thiouridylate) methyltransferase
MSWPLLVSILASSGVTAVIVQLMQRSVTQATTAKTITEAADKAVEMTTAAMTRQDARIVALESQVAHLADEIAIHRTWRQAATGYIHTLWAALRVGGVAIPAPPADLDMEVRP